MHPARLREPEAAQGPQPDRQHAGILAWGNDEGYDRIFVEQLKNLASPGDLLLAISGSGNSPNILKAVEWANRHGLITVGITGFGGGKLRTLAHHSLHAAVDDMGIAESLHQVVFHWIIDDLYRRISGPVAALAVDRESRPPTRAAATRGASPEEKWRTVTNEVTCRIC